MKTQKSIRGSFFEKKLKLDVCCIVAAAGLSSRMGFWKGDLQIPLNTDTGISQIPLINNAVNTALECCRKVILIGGEQISRIKELVPEEEGLILLENRDYKKGMLSSIQRAMDLVDSDFFIMPMDMPLIRAVHLFTIHRHYSLSKDSKIYRPVYNKCPGHPVFLPYLWKERVIHMEGKSLKSNLKADEQILIPWNDESVILDLDTKESYEKFLNNYSSVDG